MDGNLLFSLCDCVEEQVLQAREDVGISPPADTNGTLKVKGTVTLLLVADYSEPIWLASPTAKIPGILQALGLLGPLRKLD